MSFRVAICDDEEEICEEIRRKLLSIKPMYEIVIYHSGKELLQEEDGFQLVFLDIDMADLNGMETAELLRKRGTDECIIFLSGYREYMEEAFKVKAFRFLNKPIEPECFKEAVLEAEREIGSDRKLEVHVAYDIYIISIKDIVYMEAFGDGTYIFLRKDEMIRTTEPLKYWFEKVGTEDFFQVHKSYIVAYAYVKGLRKTEVIMEFAKETIPVSRRKRNDFRESLIAYGSKNKWYI
ncbi:MAG: LytTR family DNA-binding domain-containing protein [Roseburia sp.]|nr:LytTR family DNA-binding domain-containing protein [Roseburia sp.]MCM1278192.1 LytTR family DNA-binding domain-containing protein [Robinsoniella sp.]